MSQVTGASSIRRLLEAILLETFARPGMQASAVEVCFHWEQVAHF